ncbi:MAG: PAS domain S-box protein [Acidobacteria bacterium]|nr:MAG: PAS domain S-box protein [Acidobacteriota bacterium]
MNPQNPVKLALDRLTQFLFESAHDALLLVDHGGHILSANGEACQLYGYGQEEFLHRMITDLVSPGDAEVLARMVQRPSRRGEDVVRVRARRADGASLPVEIRVYNLAVESREVVLIRSRRSAPPRLATSSWLSHAALPENGCPENGYQRQVEEQLRQRHQELSTLYTIALAINQDPSTQSILHNTLAELMRVLGVSFGCIYIKQGSTFVLRSYRGFSQEEVQHLAELDPIEHPWVEETMVVREPDAHSPALIGEWAAALGIRAWVSVPLRSKNEVIGLIWLGGAETERFTPTTVSLITAVANQITMALANARLYDQMKESERKYRSIFENLVVGLYQSSPEGRILTANPALVQLLGYDSLDELLAVNISRDLYVNPEDREKNLAILHRTGRLEGVEVRLRRKDGREITVLEHARAVTDARGQVMYYEGTLMDVTEKKMLQQQLLQAQKMESIGTLAGGVAHEFNNLLTGILGYASLLLDHTEPSDPHHAHLLAIERSARRGAELTEKLLTFSRQTVRESKPIDLNALVDETVALLRGSFDASIDIEVRKDDALWPVEADTGQMQHVLMNLCINARDAMPQGGRLTIETANVNLSDVDCREWADARPGDYVVLRVSDTGVGIPPEHLPRIFDPFFTTKEVHQGTGLGLSTAYGIVKSHHGFIRVESQLGRGTRFSVYLPAVITAAPSSTESMSVTERQTGGTILVVDDEEVIRDLAKNILRREGYTVLTAESGVEAIHIYEQRGSDIALVILDLTMPKMDGRVCYYKLRELDPQVRVILSSGYGADEIVEDLLTQGVRKFVQKPYRVGDLIRAVRDVLSEQ